MQVLPFALLAAFPLGGETFEILADKYKKAGIQLIYQDLSARLLQGRPLDRSAQLELHYWYRSDWHFLNPPQRKRVQTKGGGCAEVILLKRPAFSMPGTDFSMAILLIDGKAIDWKSCWTWNRISLQEIQLEDVDGDGSLDLAFRSEPGWFGALDSRQNSKAGDKRVWLYAYAITEKGFVSLFPPSDRKLPVQCRYSTGNNPVELQVVGLPESTFEYRMIVCVVSVKNLSSRPLEIEPGRWFDLDIEDGGYFMTCYGPYDGRKRLNPGETATKTLHLLPTRGERKNLTLSWSFIPKRRPILGLEVRQD